MARQDDILFAVRDVIERHENWSNDKDGAVYPPEEFDDAVKVLLNVYRSGDWPQECIELCQRLDRFAAEWQKYVDGNWNDNGSPKDSVWVAFKDVIHEYGGVSRPQPNQLEPVHLLLEQSKDDPRRYEYVARIYGWRDWLPNGKPIWRGLLFNENGTPNVSLIQKEAETPHSVVPEGWVPPTEAERVAKETEALKNRLNAVEQRIDGQTFQKDPASIEDQLKEGQFPDVIAKGQGVTEEAVRQEAARLGITPNERVGWNTYTPEPEAEIVSDVEPERVKEESRDEEEDEPVPTAVPVPKASKTQVKKAVLELWELDDSLGTAELIEAVKTTYGFDSTPKQVAAIIRQAKRARATANAAD